MGSLESHELKLLRKLFTLLYGLMFHKLMLKSKYLLDWLVFTLLCGLESHKLMLLQKLT